MWNVLREGMLRANTSSVNWACFSGLGKGIIARIEVLALLEMFSKVIGLRGELAIKAEESLLIGGERLLWRVSHCRICKRPPANVIKDKAGIRK
jgi:hypothetical protein